MKREGQWIFTVAVDVSAGVEEYASILPLPLLPESPMDKEIRRGETDA